MIRPLALLCCILPGMLFLHSCEAKPVRKDAVIRCGAEHTDLFFPLLKGKTVGLLANPTSLIGHTHLADTLKKAGIDLRKIFVPEHGFRGQVGAGDVVVDTVDAVAGIPVISLYGPKKKPSPTDMKGLDVVIYDIQDVGVRFYTYISTLHYLMEACSDAGILLVVLDRPNPLGYYIDGPVLDTAFRSFVGMHPVPVIYGMTPGEYALMINGEGWLGKDRRCNLKVIPCSHYSHNSRYHLPVNPSPNLNSMEAVYLYPSLCFFEGTIMSLGRGTDFPFRVFGHPDYTDTAFSFIPKPNTANKAPLFVNKTCYGSDLRKLTTEQLGQMKEINLEWLIDAYQAMGRNKSFFTAYFNQLAGTAQLKKQILSGKTAAEIRETWQTDLQNFKVMRSKYLLYEDFK